MLLVCTAILYKDDPIVLVRTVPAFRLVIATTKFKSETHRAVAMKSTLGLTYRVWHGRMGIQQLVKRLQIEPNLRGERSLVRPPGQSVGE